MTSPIHILSRSVEQTVNLGKTIAQHLAGGETLALIGPLGSGKTHLVKGLSLGLDVTGDLVHSPTFTLINEYEGRLMLYHIDAYRLDNADQLAALGFDELSDNHSAVVVEWADLVWPLVKEFNPIRISIAHHSVTERAICIENTTGSLNKALQHLT